MSRINWLLFVSGAIWGCGGDSGGGESESESEGELDCSGADCATMVISRTVLPSTSQPYRCDVDLSGFEENALGGALNLIGMSLSEGEDLQTQLDQATLDGDAIVLAAIQADDYANDPDAGLQFWPGVDADSDWMNNAADTDDDGVPDEFVAGAEYAVSTENPTEPLAMGGGLTAGVAAFGPGRFVLTLPLADFGTANIELYAVNVTGPFQGPPDTALGNESETGVLCGGIPRDVFNDEIVPLIAAGANDACHDPDTLECIPDDSTCSTIQSLLDQDMDCTITNEEIMMNMLLMSVLPDDLDLFDGPPEKRVLGHDEEMDSISIGLGIMAIGASFDVPVPAPE